VADSESPALRSLPVFDIAVISRDRSFDVELDRRTA
jgi:hypothetical protein